MALFVASAFVGNAGAQASYNISYTDGVEVAEGDYFLYNVGSKAFLADGMDWGTHATADHAGRVVTLAKASEEPVAFSIYTKSFTSSDKAGYMTLNGYLDTGTNDANWVFSPVELEGYTNVYTIKHSDTQFLHYNFDDMRVNVGESTSNEYSYWILIPRETRNAAKDYTYLLQNTDFNRPWERSIWTCAAGFTNKAGGASSNLCAEVYHKVFDMYQTVSGESVVKNGKYILYNQGFYRQDGGDAPAYLYINDSKSAIALMNANGENTDANMTGASNSFNAGYYANSVTTIVTDNTLSIGVKNDNGSNWVIFDNFFLSYLGTTLLNDAVAFTNGIELEAGKWYSYNVAQDTEFKIVAGVDLSEIVYLINDGTMLTEEANANAENELSSTEVLAAGTYYIKSSVAQALSITPNVLPTTVTLSAAEIALNAASNTAELTATVGEAGAPQDVVWTSSNTDVATVVNGVVTGVTPGTTVVRATAYGYDDVYAEATVTVTYAETVVPTYVNEGAKRICYTYDENLIKNGSFEYANGFYGWLAADNSALSSSNFELVTDNDNKYLKSKAHTGSTGAGSIGTGWAIENGKTYVFGYRVKGSSAGNSGYHKVSLTNNLGTETKQISNDATPVTTSWTDVRYEFTNTDGYAYLQFRARWLGEKGATTSFDDFYLCEVASINEVGNVDYITENVPTANIGEGAFQYSQANIDAAKSLVQGEATVEDVQNAYDAMMVLNAPKDGVKYQIAISYDGYRYNGSAFTPNATPTQGIAVPVTNNSDNVNYWNDFTFTSVDGVVNGYTISITSADGATYYLCTGKQENGNSEQQIRMTTNPENALTVVVKATAIEGIYNLLNTRHNNATIGCQDDRDTDGGLYTVSAHNTMTISEAEQAEVTLTVKETGWATLILPFNAEISDDITLYSCTEVSESNELVLVEAESIVANTPYIVKGVEGATKTYDFAGYGLATADTYTAGLLTGVYKQTTATANTYVLQNHDGEVAFYLVGEVLPEIGANRCFLTAQSATAPMFSLERGEGTTSIEDVELTNENVVIYDLAGRRVEKMEKGVYIVNGKKVIR